MDTIPAIPQTHLISIGPTCYSACLLKEFGYRFEAFPFDWLFSSLNMVAHCIETDFRDFLDIKYLYDIAPDGSRHVIYNQMIDTPNLRKHHIEHGYPVFRDNGEINWRVFNHHNLTNPTIHESFVRRCARFMDALRGSDPVLLVYLNRNTNDCDKIVEFARRMSFRDGVTVIGIIERAGTTRKILHQERGVIVFETDAARNVFTVKNDN
jgi:hypothetical protein